MTGDYTIVPFFAILYLFTHDTNTMRHEPNRLELADAMVSNMGDMKDIIYWAKRGLLHEEINMMDDEEVNEMLQEM